MNFEKFYLPEMEMEGRGTSTRALRSERTSAGAALARSAKRKATRGKRRVYILVCGVRVFSSDFGGRGGKYVEFRGWVIGRRSLNGTVLGVLGVFMYLVLILFMRSCAAVIISLRSV